MFRYYKANLGRGRGSLAELSVLSAFFVLLVAWSPAQAQQGGDLLLKWSRLSPTLI